VSGDLRIRRFTPMAEKVLNLIPTDVGRPISDIKPNINGADLDTLIPEVIESVNTEEREVRDRHGNWYSLRIRPYKNIENRIDGAVVALFDIDAARRQEIAAREAREYADAIVDTVREPMVVLDSELRVRRANRAFWQTFRTVPADTQNRRIDELGDGQWDIPDLRKQLQTVSQNTGRLENYRVEHEFPGVGRRVMLLNARAMRLDDGRNGLVLLAFEDVTDRDRKLDTSQALQNLKI
jgi:two-component system CheB/CheR fusion protein